MVQFTGLFKAKTFFEPVGMNRVFEWLSTFQSPKPFFKTKTNLSLWKPERELTLLTLANQSGRGQDAGEEAGWRSSGLGKATGTI